MTDDIRRAVRKRLIDCDMTMTGLAHQVGVSPGHVSDLLGGKRGALSPTWAAIFDVLDLELLVMDELPPEEGRIYGPRR